MANRLPIEEFHAERKKRKSKLISGLTILLLAQVLAAGYYGKQIVEMDFHNRVYREYEIRKTGSIEIPTGIYSGETDYTTDISLLIKNMDKSVPVRYLTPEISERRLNCHQKCAYGKCKFCYNAFSLASILAEKGDQL